MWTTLMALVLSLSLAPTAQAGLATQLLQRYLDRAQQTTTPFEIVYDFVINIDSPDETRKLTYEVESVNRDGTPYVVAHVERPTKVYLETQSICVKASDRWDCRIVDPTQFAKNLKQRHMSLYPPTAMHLVQQFTARHADAVLVSAAGSRTVAGRACDAFHVGIDVSRVDRTALRNFLYIDVKDDTAYQSVTGARLELCFDRDSGQVIEYQNELVVDQTRLRGGLYAKRVE